MGLGWGFCSAWRRSLCTWMPNRSIPCIQHTRRCEFKYVDVGLRCSRRRRRRVVYDHRLCRVCLELLGGGVVTFGMTSTVTLSCIFAQVFFILQSRWWRDLGYIPCRWHSSSGARLVFVWHSHTSLLIIWVALWTNVDFPTFPRGSPDSLLSSSLCNHATFFGEIVRTRRLTDASEILHSDHGILCSMFLVCSKMFP